MPLRRVAHPCLLAAFALAAVAAGGCEAITGPSELERKIAAEQQVIAAYSAKVPEVDALQRRFIERWAEANEEKDLEAYREALREKVLPALRRYVEAAKAMPTGASEELAGIHAILVDAYEAALTQFQAFTDALTEDNLEEGYAQVVAKMDAVKEAEATYLARLKTYYAKNRVDLVEEPAQPAKPGEAQPPAQEP